MLLVTVGASGSENLMTGTHEAKAPRRRHPTIRPCAVASGFPVVALKSSEGCVPSVKDILVMVTNGRLTKIEAMMPKSYPKVTDPSAAKRPHNHV